MSVMWVRDGKEIDTVAVGRVKVLEQGNKLADKR